MDLVRPVAEAKRAHAGVDLREREVLGEPGGAVDLDRAVEHPLAGVRRRDLELGINRIRKPTEMPLFKVAAQRVIDNGLARGGVSPYS